MARTRLGSGAYESIASSDDEGFQASFIDASVRFIPRNVTAKTLNALLTINGKEIVDDPALK